MYRTNASSTAAELPPPGPNRLRTVLIVVATLGLHGVVFGAAFASRERPPAPRRTAVVSVLTGQVDPWTGDFSATGIRNARIRE